MSVRQQYTCGPAHCRQTRRLRGLNGSMRWYINMALDRLLDKRLGWATKVAHTGHLATFTVLQLPSIPTTGQGTEIL